MIWLRGTFEGEVVQYGIPLDEKIGAILRDETLFDTLEIVSIDHAYDGINIRQDWI
jgi:hypothetical protein